MTGKLIGLLLDFVQGLSTQKLTAQKGAAFLLALTWESLLLPLATCTSVFNFVWTPVSLIQTASVPWRNTRPVPGLRAGAPAWHLEPQAAVSGFLCLCPEMLCLKATEVVL